MNDVEIKDTELGNLNLNIGDEAALVKLNENIRLQEERMKNSLLTQKEPEKVIPKEGENHQHIVATF